MQPNIDTGSSLRAQGTPPGSSPDGWQSRFIPAGAGNTPVGRKSPICVPVHPCGRREHELDGIKTTAGDGSSLRAQGTPVTVEQLTDYRRFIPAGAGNTG